MANVVDLPAEPRRLGRKIDLKQVRREGKIPAILYGRGIPPRPLQISTKEMDLLLRRHGHTAILQLQVDGEEPVTAMIKELDLHRLTGDVQHLGLQNINLTDTIHTTVRIALVGGSGAVEEAGGVLEQPLTDLQVSGRADQMPESVTLDISGLQMGDTLRVRDIELPEGITAESDPDRVVVTTSISSAARQEAAEAVAEEAAEAAAEAVAEAVAEGEQENDES